MRLFIRFIVVTFLKAFSEKITDKIFCHSLRSWLQAGSGHQIISNKSVFLSENPTAICRWNPGGHSFFLFFRVSTAGDYGKRNTEN